jgi:flavin-dependent dehydrogenase
MKLEPEQTYDVVVIGGGPAGATAAALLAEQGHHVAVLEKEKFPRYHVGESLLPYAYFSLKRLGLIEKMKASHFPQKHSVQFVSTEGKVATPFYFFKHTDHELATTWQVERSEFDQMLLENAREKGADVFEQTAVVELIEQDGKVRGVKSQRKGETVMAVTAPMTIDASGRSALAMSRKGWRRNDPELNRVAYWTYYRGAMRDPGLDAGSTTIAYLPNKSWFWYIPLPNDLVSVGVVGEKEYLLAEGSRPADVLARNIPLNPWIQQHLATGEQVGKFYGTKEFSYRSQHCAQDGLVLAGDAFAFLDPVFSSGLYFALRSGELAADAVDASLGMGETRADHFQDYAQRMTSEIEAMRKLVYAFYDATFSFGDLIRQYPEVRTDLTDCLIGNLQKDFSRLFSAAGELAEMPAELPYGRPLESTVACAKVNES